MCMHMHMHMHMCMYVHMTCTCTCDMCMSCVRVRTARFREHAYVSGMSGLLWSMRKNRLYDLDQISRRAVRLRA